MALMAETETETASDGRNVVLERLLARAGWTPEGLGDRLNQLAATLGLRAHVNRRSARRWIYPEASRTAARRPRERWPALICHLLHERLGVPVSPESLGWTTTGPLRYVPADDELDQPWNSVGAVASLATVIDADAVERRHFLALTGLTLTSAAHQWLIDPARVAASLLGKRADHALVDELERVADARRRMDDALGGGTLLRTVNEDLRVVVGLLKNASYTEEVGRRLYAVAAQFGRVAGWIACDCEQPALAQRYFLAALRAAHVSGDRALGADVLGFMSIQAAQSDSPRDAVTLAESALAHEKMLTPGVAAMLHGRLAVGAAYAGDEMVSRRAQKRVIDLTSRSTRELPWGCGPVPGQARPANRGRAASADYTLAHRPRVHSGPRSLAMRPGYRPGRLALGGTRLQNSRGSSCRDPSPGLRRHSTDARPIPRSRRAVCHLDRSA
jgi:hypothetical protein